MEYAIRINYFEQDLVNLNSKEEAEECAQKKISNLKPSDFIITITRRPKK